MTNQKLICDFLDFYKVTLTANETSPFGKDARRDFIEKNESAAVILLADFLDYTQSKSQTP